MTCGLYLSYFRHISVGYTGLANKLFLLCCTEGKIYVLSQVTSKATGGVWI